MSWSWDGPSPAAARGAGVARYQLWAHPLYQGNERLSKDGCLELTVASAAPILKSARPTMSQQGGIAATKGNAHVPSGCFQCIHTPGSCVNVVAAEQLAASKKFDVNVLMAARLCTRHSGTSPIQARATMSRSSSLAVDRLSPKHPDTEQTIGEVRAIDRKTVAFAESVTKHSAWANERSSCRCQVARSSMATITCCRSRYRMSISI